MNRDIMTREAFQRRGHLLKMRLLRPLCWLAMAFFSWMPLSQAEEYFGHFKSIPVLHEGRIKPLDTFARNLLLQFSGRENCGRTEASAWLAKLLFAPVKTMEDKIFLINDPNLAVALNIKPEEARRYSFAQIRGHYFELERLKKGADRIDEAKRSLTENEIIRVAQNVDLYLLFTMEFQWAYPNPDFTLDASDIKAELNLPQEQNQFSYIDLASRAEKLKALAFGLKTAAKNPLTPSQMELWTAVSHMYQWSKNNQDLPFLVIPVRQASAWVSPWDAMAQDFSNDQTRALIAYWQQMALAFSAGRLSVMDQAARHYCAALNNSLPPDVLKTIRKFPIELAYHAAGPFSWARAFYILTFIFFIVSFASSSKIWYALGCISLLAGWIPHALGLLARILIMGRPPVSSLYETFIFVSFICVSLCFCIEYFNRRWLGLVTAALSGTALLFIAGRYSAEGDTLKMLVAVLNSNFWLGTHVTTITMGYGATCVVGILGHIWLIQAALKKKAEVLEATHKTILGMMGVALTLTFLGTNLGGIWADQSWGRFWGWDPKENGALMIVLWLAILFHAKYAKMISAFGLAVGCVIGMMVVMWAWFGVNLLSIGLHSYGFTSGIANALFIFAGAEILFILAASAAVYLI